MKITLTFILVFLQTFYLSAQNVHWGGAVNVTYNDNIFDLRADNDANLIICGQFSGTVDFDPGPGVAAMTATGTGEDIFLAKYDSAGNYLWSHGFGTGFFYDECDRVAVDSSGNIFITGMWNGTIDFNPDPVVVNNLSSNNNSRSRFLAKYDAAGNYIEAKNVGNAVGTLPSSQDGQSGLGCDADGNVYMSGFYGTSLAIGPGTTLSVSGLSDNYFSKFDAQLNLIWAHRIGSNETEYSQGMYVHPSGKIIVLGSFRNTVDFDPGPGTFNMTQVSSTQEGYFASYDSSGQFLFAKQLSAGTSASPIATLIDSDNNIIVTGSCAGGMDADPGVDSAMVGEGFNDQAFVAAYDSAGNYRWAFAYGDINAYNAIRYVGVDSVNNIFVCGNYEPMTDINPGQDTAVFGNKYGAYVSSFDTSGNFRNAFFLPEAKMRVKGDDIYLASGFYGLVDFDPGPQVFNLQSDTANASWYMLRMHLCDDFAASPGTINIPPLCIGDTVILSVAQGGPQYLWEFSPGFTPVGSVAGDSVIVVVDSNAVQVTIWVNSIDGCMNSPLVYSVTDVHQPVVPVIIFNSFGDTLLTQVPALYYQWYQDGIPVLNANDSAFYPMAPAYYSVMTIDSNGCEALSDSLLFLPEGLDDFQTNLIHVYPNPFTDIITLSHTEIGNTIRIKNYSGQTLLQQQTNDFSTAIDGTIMSAGIYFIEYQNKEKTYYCKLVKISDPK